MVTQNQELVETEQNPWN